MSSPSSLVSEEALRNRQIDSYFSWAWERTRCILLGQLSKLRSLCGGGTIYTRHKKGLLKQILKKQCGKKLASIRRTYPHNNSSTVVAILHIGHATHLDSLLLLIKCSYIHFRNNSKCVFPKKKHHAPSHPHPSTNQLHAQNDLWISTSENALRYPRNICPVCSIFFARLDI